PARCGRSPGGTRTHRLDRPLAEAGLHRRPMLEGMYTAAAGMAAQQERLDAVANDLANVSTTGYKHARLAFRDLVYSQGGHDQANVPPGAGARATALGPS